MSPENLELVDNKGNKNCLFLAISYHAYNNFRYYKEIRTEIVKRLNERADEILMITINNNFN